MSEAYERVKGGRLTFKGGALSKPIDKNKKNKKKHINKSSSDDPNTEEILTATAATEEGGDDDIYTIDAAKKMKYDDLFPVEAKKFGYDPKAKVKSVETALEEEGRSLLQINKFEGRKFLGLEQHKCYLTCKQEVASSCHRATSRPPEWVCSSGLT